MPEPYALDMIDRVASRHVDLAVSMLAKYYGLLDVDKQRLKAALLERVRGVLMQPDLELQEQGLAEIESEGYTMDEVAASLVAGGLQ